jgi:potassium-dependent mechanosensitive channel
MHLAESRLRDRILSSQVLLSWVCLLLFCPTASFPFSANEVPAKGKKTAVVRPAKKPPAKTKHHPEPPPIPESITLAGGEVISTPDIIARSGAAQKQLQDIFSKLQPPDIQQALANVNNVSRKIAESRQNTEKSISLARSTLQLKEIEVDWFRDRTQLQSSNAIVTAYRTNLDDLQKQLQAIRETWDPIAAASAKAKLPDQFTDRIDSVQMVENLAETDLREEISNLIQLQIQVSDALTKVDEVLEQIKVAEGALREQVFVIDSPPLWSALHMPHWNETKHQIRTYVDASVSRSEYFFQSYRSKLLVYCLLSIVIMAIVLQLSRQDLTAEALEQYSRYFACLQHPYAISAYVSLLLIGSVFVKAPPEFSRLVRLLLTIPIVLIAFSFFDRRMRPFLAGVGAFFAVNIITLQFLSGTLLRRIITFFFTSALLAAMAYLLRKGGMARTFLAERGWVFTSICCWMTMLFLLASTIANVIGIVSLADLLFDGTIISLYGAIGVYVFFAVLVTLTAAFTVSNFGKRSRALRFHGATAVRKVAAYGKVASWAIWITTVLLAFQVSDAAFGEARDLLYHKWQFGTISLSLLDIVLFCLVLIVSNIIAKLIRFILDEEILPRTSMDSGTAQAGSRLTYIGLLILGGFLAFGAAGLELSKFSMMTGALGVGLGFGLQNVVSNFVSGIILSLERPMKIGDLIEMNNLAGEVTAIGFRSSTVRTFEGADVIVPNSDLIAKSFVNWSLTDQMRRTDIPIAVAYGTNPRVVLEILNRIVSGHPGVLQTPAPLITFDQFGESSLNCTVRFWSRIDTRVQIRSELNLMIDEEFAKEGIEIPFPQRDVHVKLDGKLPQSWPVQTGATTAVAGK